MNIRNCYYEVKTETAPIVAFGGMIMDRFVTGRQVSVTMTLDFTGDELESVGATPWEIPDRIVKALTKPEVQRALISEVRRPRAYGEET